MNAASSQTPHTRPSQPSPGYGMPQRYEEALDLMLQTTHTLAPTTTCHHVCTAGKVHVPADKRAFTERFRGLPLKYATRVRAAWAIQACIHDDLKSDRDVPCPNCALIDKHKTRA